MRLNYNFLDLYPYISLYIIFILINYSTYKEKYKFFILFFILWLFTICRYDVGWDYLTYVEEIKRGVNYIEESRYELFSRSIFYWAIKWKFYPLIFIIFGTIQLILLAFGIYKLSTNKALSWTIYFLFPLFFLQDLSTIRQATATAFVFVSYYWLKNNQYVKFILFIIAGSLFHQSALYGFMIFFICKKELPLFVNWLLFILSFVVGNYWMYLISTLNIDRFNVYINGIYQSHSTSLLNYLYYIINLFILFNYRKLIKDNPDNLKYIQLSNWGIVTFNLFLFEPVASTRLSVFFLLFWILLLPSIVKIYKVKFIFIMFFVIINICFLMLYVNAFNSRILYKISFIPYDFWWNHL